MTREIENQLKQMFADLDEDLPAADFTPHVMSGVLKPARRARLLWSSAILATFAFLGFSFPYLAPGLRIVAGFPPALIERASESLAALSHSPIAYVYGTALGGYVLLRLVRRLRETE